METQNSIYREIDESKKEAVEVRLYTKDFIVEGTTYKSLGHRFSDHLNSTSEDFISLKDVKVFSFDKKEVILNLLYLGVNKVHIIMITEL